MEAGRYVVISAAYPVMKMTRASLQRKWEYMVITATHPVMKITRVSLQ